MKHYLSFDVESIGLFGPPFAFGYVVVDESGDEKESGIYGWDYRGERLGDSAFTRCGVNDRWDCTNGDRAWVAEHVIPTLPEGWANCSDIGDFVRSVYERVWLRCQSEYENLIFVTDCPFPVEANFVETMLKVMIRRRMDYSPYPLIDVGSVLVGRGLDPTKEYSRRENELPAHNPVNDSRQSVRIMLDAILGRFQVEEPESHGQLFCPMCGHPLKVERKPDEDGDESIGYRCTNDVCIYSYGGLALHHPFDNDVCTPVQRNHARAPGDSWSLSYVK